MKNIRFKNSCRVLLVVALASGCTTTNQGPVKPGLGAGIGALGGALLGGAIDKDNRGRGALIGGALGALAGYAITKHYNASQRQRAQAQEIGLRYVSEPSNAKRLEEKKTRYVAVPVKSEKSGGKDIVLYDTKTNESETLAYETPSGKSFESGEIVEVGGKEAMVATAFQGL